MTQTTVLIAGGGIGGLALAPAELGEDPFVQKIPHDL